MILLNSNHWEVHLKMPASFEENKGKEIRLGQAFNATVAVHKNRETIVPEAFKKDVRMFHQILEEMHAEIIGEQKEPPKEEIEHGECMDCGKKVKKPFPRCYACNLKNKESKVKE